MISRDIVFSSYQNVITLYKIFYTLPVSSAIAEKSFSRLRLFKTFLRSTMTSSLDRLSNLAMLSIGSNITAQTIDLNYVIRTFALMKNRKKLL